MTQPVSKYPEDVSPVVSREDKADAALRPWGLLASLVWYLVIFEIGLRLQDYIESSATIKAFFARGYLFHSADILVSWGINFALIVLAVKLTRAPLSYYLAWRRPRLSDIVAGLAAILAFYAVFIFLLYFGGAAAQVAKTYRDALAAGTSPWWFVLRWWPAIVLAPFVEESFFRGFLWRGVEFYHGKWAAFFISTLLFVAMHYRYWAAGGIVDPPSVLVYLIAGSIFGWLRWRSGSTLASMFAHSLDNTLLQVMQIVLSGLAP